MVPPPPGAVTASTSLREDPDPKDLLATLTRAHTVKGMFIARFVDELGSRWTEVAAELVAPPKLGRYLPFSDYPMVDQAHLAFGAARRRFPKVPLEEAARRLARDDLGIFLQSTLGRITMAVLDGPRSALMAIPGGYRHTVRGCRYEAAEAGAREVHLSLIDLDGSWGYQIGQIEGIVMHWEVEPTIRCAVVDARTRRFEVTW